MADAPVNGGGSGRGRDGDDNNGGNPPKRPRKDEPAPQAGPSNEQQPRAGGSRDRAPAAPQPGPVRRQRDDYWLPPPGPDVYVLRTKADLYQWLRKMWPEVWAQMRQPGPLVDPYYWTRVPRETLRQLERRHHARLVNFWERIIMHYRGLQPMELRGVRRYDDAQEEQVAPQLPPGQVNAPAAGPQGAQNADEQEVVAGPGEQAVPDVDVGGDGDGDGAEPEP